ncbi:MAG: cell division protein ZipA [Gammaproteobacteria bacterium]|nr:MAG: cell division protein ZipA [Gammaproteobacteria bacterium]
MLTTIILCVLGLALIGAGAYLWYRRHIEDESSFGHDDIRWEQIDDADAAVEKTVPDMDRLTASNDIEAQPFDRVAHFDATQSDDTRMDGSYGQELDQFGKLMREQDVLDVELEPVLDVEAGHHLATGELQDFQEEPVTQATLGDNPEMVVSVYVVAKPDSEFHGEQLLEAFDKLGLKYGDRDIFHFYDTEQIVGPILFSVANMLEPGTFDPNTMASTKTHGVTLFMLLPGPDNNVHTFERLLDIGHRLARRLGGELHDSQRSALTSQGANLIKESIHQFYSQRKMKQGQLNL